MAKKKFVLKVGYICQSRHDEQEAKLSLGLPTVLPHAADYCQIASPADLEILGSRRIGVTSLTFRSHVTSSVTSPFDSS